jgi:hypothetical protein
MSFAHNPLADGILHDCDGTPVIEYSDPDGDHWHCPKCGAWAIQASTTQENTSP